jgi:hypothetical protein
MSTTTSSSSASQYETDTATTGSYFEEERLNEAEWEAEWDMEDLEDRADRLAAKAKRCRDQADAMENKSKRLRTRAKRLNDVRISFKFDALCLAIRRNDPDTTTFWDHQKLIDFPQGYARPLGKALRGNTHVKTLPVDLGKLALSLDANTAPTLAVLTEAIGGLIDYVKKGTALRKVIIEGSLPSKRTSRAISNLFLDAVVQSQSIESLCMYNCRATLEVLRTCLLSMELKDLRIQFLTNHKYSQEERRLFASVFASVASLETVSFYMDDTDTTVAVLHELRGHSSLQELEICCDLGSPSRVRVEAVKNILLSPNVLQHVSLGGVEFDMETMDLLMNGLQRRVGSVSTVTVSHLSFLNCEFDDDAQFAFESFMRARIGPTKGLVTSLQKLTIDWQSVMESEWDERSFVSMFCRKLDCGKSYEIVGSQISVLSFSGIMSSSCRWYLNEMVKMAHRISLQELHLPNLYSEDCSALARCISRLSTLRELVIEDVTDLAQLVHVFRSLRACGNLRNVSILAKRFDSPLPDAYCDRNQFFAKLLRKDAESASKSGKAGDNADPLGDDAKSLYPTLFEAAKQVPREKLSVMMLSLLALCKSIGPTVSQGTSSVIR